jgi:ion channel POLLUX/CASTOR
MASLLLIRDIQRKRGRLDCTVISEITDPRTKQLISVANISDYVVSNELVSMAMAMIAESREIKQVLGMLNERHGMARSVIQRVDVCLSASVAELWTADGNEVFTRDMQYYVKLGESVSFWQLMQRANARNEIALGYKRKGMMAC